MRFLFCGGGTGGHIYPALAILKGVIRKWPHAQVLYVGAKNGLENQIIPQEGIPFTTVDVQGLERKVSPQALVACWKTAAGIRQAGKIIREFSPDLVVGTGGYACLPVMWAATRQRIPTLLHEQNAVPGLANRILAGRVNGILLTFAEAREHFPSRVRNKLEVTGLPVRPEIIEATREEALGFFGFAAEKSILLVTGGSRGAKSINEAMLEFYRAFLDGQAGDRRYRQLAGLQVIHLTGSAGYDEYRRKLAAAGIDVGNCGNIIIRPYLTEMKYALACADLCVARAGAAFLSEMTARGIPGILVPYPFAAGNHQEHNALSLVKKGAAEMVLDKDLTGKELIRLIMSILGDKTRLKLMAKKSKEAGNPEAIEKIIQAVTRHLPPDKQPFPLLRPDQESGRHAPRET